MRKREPPTESRTVSQSKGPGESKISTQLVERPRDDNWWHDQDFIAPVPQFAAPAVFGTTLAVVHGNNLYCLDSRFDYAKSFDANLNDSVGMCSAPSWCGSERIGVAALLRDGRYQAIVANPRSREVMRRTLMRGKAYAEMYMWEDRHPLSPVAYKKEHIFIDPYGHYYNHESGASRVLGRNIRVRKQPCLDSSSRLVVQLGNSKKIWLEWRDPSTGERLLKSTEFETIWGISTGFTGSAPKVTADANILCGFGDRLICFDVQGQAIWVFPYPQLDARDPTGGVKVYSGEGARELIYESSSEVTISSDVVEHGSHLYFVLSEGTGHTSYITKMAKHSGDVIWTSRIDGYSGAFAIPYVAESGVLLQQDRWLWPISQDGSQRGEFALDLDGTSCSDAVRISEDLYAVNSNLGIHTFTLDLPSINARVSPSTGYDPEARRVFLSHASEDKTAIVRPFYEACERKGISAWYDAAEIRWGDSLVAKVEDGLAKSRIVLLFLSRDFLRKPWPEKELTAALSLEMSGRGTVLPLVLGLSHEELESKHPFVASKLYRLVEAYNPGAPVSTEFIESLVDELAERLRNW